MAESKGLSVSPIEEDPQETPEGAAAATAGTAGAEARPAREAAPDQASAAEEAAPDEVGPAGEAAPDQAGAAGQPGQGAGPDEAGAAEEEVQAAGYRLRRAPRYRAFGLTGVLLGVIVGAVLALSFQATGDYSTQTILGYFVAIFGLLGALAGGGAAVLLERRKD